MAAFLFGYAVDIRPRNTADRQCEKPPLEAAFFIQSRPQMAAFLLDVPLTPIRETPQDRQDERPPEWRFLCPDFTISLEINRSAQHSDSECATSIPPKQDNPK